MLCKPAARHFCNNLPGARRFRNNCIVPGAAWPRVPCLAHRKRSSAGSDCCSFLCVHTCACILMSTRLCIYTCVHAYVRSAVHPHKCGYIWTPFPLLKCKVRVRAVLPVPQRQAGCGDLLCPCIHSDNLQPPVLLVQVASPTLLFAGGGWG